MFKMISKIKTVITTAKIKIVGKYFFLKILDV